MNKFKTLYSTGNGYSFSELIHIVTKNMHLIDLGKVSKSGMEPRKKSVSEVNFI